MLIVCLYVDDLIYSGSNTTMFGSFKKSMLVEFEMSDLDMMHYFLGIEVLHKDDGGKKVNNTLYKQIVGRLMYLTATRPDIMHVVSVISSYMECPTKIHLLAAKRILRYLQGTKEFGLFFKRGEKLYLFGFTDSDYAEDSDDCKSTSRYVFMLGTRAISWSSKKQPIVTLSTTEAEFVAATACARQAIWLKKILEDLQFREDGPTLIYCDNSSTIKLLKNPVLHMVEASI
ncbi:secreted RxLR effector protein 161-like [Malania oleifera]|uniref:secreted RxLR effector protein 161-like n=1 Tax=Malania oleifera TaxID=397392 RepID=UPI0025AE403F|nr:secreted RxLR effector protein 161-like [Malania oleifera]